jgi:hypothetical protein
MLKCLGLGMLLVACSSESGLVSSESVGGVGGERVTAGTSGASASTPAGGTAAASSGAGGSRADAGDGGAGEAGALIGGGSAGGAHPEEGGAAGSLASAGAGAGGATGNAGATSASGSAGGGASGSSGSGGATAGAGGSTTQPDPCTGERHWDPNQRWTDYEQGDQRVFGGVLWHCQSPSLCTAYPGHSSSPGWFKDAECAGGPTSEVAACQCTSGQCCDGCYVRPTSHFCGEFVRKTSCYGATVAACGGATKTLDRDYWNLFCDGAESAQCTRWGAHTKYHPLECAAGSGCVEQGDQASCGVCN